MDSALEVGSFNARYPRTLPSPHSRFAIYRRAKIQAQLEKGLSFSLTTYPMPGFRGSFRGRSGCRHCNHGHDHRRQSSEQLHIFDLKKSRKIGKQDFS